MPSRFPRLSISVSNGSDGTDSTGDINLLCVGFGIFQAWLCIAIFGTSSIFSPSDLIPAFPALPAEFSLVVLNSFMITLGVCLLLLALSNQLLLKFYVGKSALILATILAAAGTYLIYASCVGGTSGWFIAVFSGIAMGAGASLMTVLWGTAFSRYEFATIILNAIIAIVIGIAIYVLLVHWIPTPFSGLIIGLFPIIGAILLWRLTPTPYYNRQEIPIFHPLPVNRTSFVLRIGIPTLIFGFILGALRYICVIDVLPISNITSQLVIGAAACAGIIAVIVTVMISKGGSYWDTIFRCLVPVIAISIFCIPFLASGTALPACFFLIAGYVCFEMLMWFLFSDISQTFRLSPIFVFGLGRGILEIGAFIGTLLAQPIFSDTFSGVFVNAEWTAGLLLALVLAYALLPRQREVSSIVAPVQQTANQNEAFAEQLDQQGNPIDGNAQEASGQMSAEEETKRSKGRFHLRCEEIADTYMLSRRETEVLFLLAKGHNASFIQDKLCISKSTAKTHINHIYRKLDIHTQQELLNMVEDRPHGNIDDDDSSSPEANATNPTSSTTPTANASRNANLRSDIFEPRHRN